MLKGFSKVWYEAVVIIFYVVSHSVLFFMLDHTQFPKFTLSMVWSVVDFTTELRKIIIGRNLAQISVIMETKHYIKEH
jgi:hypothetical protein